MKILTRLLLLFFSLLGFSQEEEKETVYLLFDTMNKQKCIVEDGSGNSSKQKKYRKQHENHLLFFIVCDEYFAFNTKKSKVDTCSIKMLDTIKIVDTSYLNDKKSKNVMRYNPFKKIYVIEKISKDRILKYDVTWIDDWTMTRN